MSEAAPGPDALPAPPTRPRTRPALVAVLVLLLYAAFVGACLFNDGVGSFPAEGAHWTDRIPAGSPIRVFPRAPGASPLGYDGQFFYFIAADPAGAAPYLDDAAYRYGRILYPMLARALALGRPALIPWTLILVNLAAAAAAAWAVAVWLRRRGLSPWLALVLAFAPGMLTALRFDLSEALAYGLVALGVLAYDLRRPWARVVVSGLLFAAATLTRETTAVYPLVFAGVELAGADVASALRALRGLSLGAIALLPYLAWKAFLTRWLGSSGTPLGSLFETLPYRGILTFLFHPSAQVQPQVDLVTAAAQNVAIVVVPSTLVAGLVLRAFWVERRTFAMGWLYLLNYVPFVVFLSRNSYTDAIAAPRIIDGVILAGLLCLPRLLRTVPRTPVVFGAATALWLAVTPVWFLSPLLEALYVLAHRLR